MKAKHLFGSLIVIAAIIGAVASFYALLAHYDAASSEFCTISETFNCDIVNKSRYSEILGIPVSLMGLVTYIFFVVATIVYKKKKMEWLMNLMIFGVVTGFLFSLYLTGIEAFVLHAWCLLCIISQISIILVMIGVFGLKHATNDSGPVSMKELHQ